VAARDSRLRAARFRSRSLGFAPSFGGRAVGRGPTRRRRAL